MVKMSVKLFPHRRQIGIRPELSGRISIHFNGNFALAIPDECQFVAGVDGPLLFLGSDFSGFGWKSTP